MNIIFNIIKLGKFIIVNLVYIFLDFVLKIDIILVF